MGFAIHLAWKDCKKACMPGLAGSGRILATWTWRETLSSRGGVASSQRRRSATLEVVRWYMMNFRRVSFSLPISSRVAIFLYIGSWRADRESLSREGGLMRGIVIHWEAVLSLPPIRR